MPAPVPHAIPRPRLYERLADHITTFIDAQGLRPGDRLPPERSLATEFGVSRATLSRALVALEVRGRISVEHGNGAVVLDPGTDQLPWAAVAPAQLASLRASVLAGLARLACRAPVAVREASLGPGGSEISWPSCLRVLRRLGADSVLAATIDSLIDPDDPPPEPALVARLCELVLAADAEAATDLCWAIWARPAEDQNESYH